MVNAQYAVLGCLLIDGDALAGEIFQRVSAEDFTDSECRTVFTALRSIFSEGARLDPVIVLGRVGNAYETLIRSAMADTPTTRNWAAYCELLRKEGRLNRLHALALELLDVREPDEAQEIVGRAERVLVGRQEARVTALPQGLAELYTYLSDTHPPQYLDWGIAKINERVFVEDGDFVIIGAEPSVGKTAFALQVAFRIAQKRRVGFYSLETGDRKLLQRVVAQQTDVLFEHVKKKTLNEDDFTAVAELGTASSAVRLELVQAAGFTADDIRAMALARRHEVVFIDYVQLLGGDGKNRMEVVTNTSMKLHTFAQTTGVTVIALSQFSRADAGEKTRHRP